MGSPSRAKFKEKRVPTKCPREPAAGCRRGRLDLLAGACPQARARAWRGEGRAVGRERGAGPWVGCPPGDRT